MVAPDQFEELLKDDSARRVRSWLEAIRGDSKAMFSVGIAIEYLYGKRRTDAGDADSYYLDSERDLIQYALDFANEKTDRSEIHRYMGLPRVIRSPGATLHNPAHIIMFQETQTWPADDAAEAAQAERMLENDLRTAWRALFSKIKSDRQKAMRDFKGNAEKQLLSNVWSLPEFVSSRSGDSLRHPIILPDRRSFDAYVAFLLLDEVRGLGSDLKQCQLDDCRIFFLVKKQQGRPQFKYCSPDHMEEHHALGSTARSKAARKRAAEKKARKPK